MRIFADAKRFQGQKERMSFQYVEDHRDYLKREYEARLGRRPFYSQRAFARDIGLSPSALTDYFKGRIRLSSARITQVGKTLKLSPEQKQHWVDLIDMKFAKTPEVKKMSMLRVKARMASQSHSISLDQFKIVSEWFHFALRELIQMNAEKYSDLKVAATELGIPLQSAKIAAKRLEKVGLLTKDSRGLYSVDPSAQVGDSIPSMAIRSYHSQILKKAAQALETQPMEKRFASSTLVALPQAEVEKILVAVKSLALEFLDPYLVQAESQPKQALYCFSLQFFDLLTQKERKP